MAFSHIHTHTRIISHTLKEGEKKPQNICRQRPGLSRVIMMWRACSIQAMEGEEFVQPPRCQTAKHDHMEAHLHMFAPRFTRGNTVRGVNKRRSGTHMKAARVSISGAVVAQRWEGGMMGAKRVCVCAPRCPLATAWTPDSCKGDAQQTAEETDAFPERDIKSEPLTAHEDGHDEKLLIRKAGASGRPPKGRLCYNS